MSRSHGIPVIDAWVQPWLPSTVAKMPERNFTLADRMAHGARLRTGLPLEALIDEMDANGIVKAICSAGPLIPNEDVVDAVRRYPDRLIGVASVNPWSVDGVMPAVHELRRLVSDFGFKGLKLEPFILDKVPTEPQWYPLYAACADLDITLQVQVGGTGPSTYTSETGRPGHIDRIAIDFPELRIVAGHIGWPWTEEMIAVAAKHPNVWIDTSAHLPKYYPPHFTHFLRTYGRRKCIWASDWPILTFEAALDGLAELELAPEVAQLFLSDNAARAFALLP
ncbi:amidohydrolase family protein [[Mycobacterium] vasticus]|uniref:Amidohydrolase family protein n=1 Tax=[Mycobacterium] vasticus TaxID=2875777 RepID=A0ABU5YZI4_9MYCO|nr:amidohydrolase family protein [Mycolicibacter sp. MYC017]MEB3070310.1 amidohydrolase family protein [Mycolicibacter sp. MYC017]